MLKNTNTQEINIYQNPDSLGSYRSNSSNALSSSTSSKGKSKDKQTMSVIGRSYYDVDIAIDTNCKDEPYDLNKCLQDTKEILARISNLEIKVKNKFKNIDLISSEEEDFHDKIVHLYGAANDFRNDLNDYMNKNSCHCCPDPSRLTNAAKKYKKYLQRFEQFDMLDKQRERLQTLWEEMLQVMKNKKMKKEMKEVNEIISDVTFDAYDYLQDQDQEKFNKVLKNNEFLYNQYLNKLTYRNREKENLNQLMGWLGNDSGEAEKNDLKNNSILNNHQPYQTSSMTTSTTVLFAHKKMGHKEKSKCTRSHSTLK